MIMKFFFRFLFLPLRKKTKYYSIAKKYRSTIWHVFLLAHKGVVKKKRLLYPV